MYKFFFNLQKRKRVLCWSIYIISLWVHHNNNNNKIWLDYTELPKSQELFMYTTTLYLSDHVWIYPCISFIIYLQAFFFIIWEGTCRQFLKEEGKCRQLLKEGKCCQLLKEGKCRQLSKEEGKCRQLLKE